MQTANCKLGVLLLVLGAAAWLLGALPANAQWGEFREDEKKVVELPPEKAVETGRKALQERTYYPWYDEEADGVRRVAVEPTRPPPKPANPQWQWPEWKGWNFSWNLADIFWNLVQALFWGVIIALLVFLTVLLTRFFLGRESAAAVSSETSQHVETGVDPDRVEHLPFDAPRLKGDLLAQARRFYEQGDYGQAIVYYFSHLLLELDRHQIIRLTRGKTNRQYLREIRRRRREMAGLVEQTMVAFEDFFFGDHPLDRERFESCWRGLETFEKQLQQSA